MQVAQTIIEQLGGQRFIAMTGAKNFVGSHRAVHFAIGRSPEGVSRVIVTLAADDTYALECYFLRGFHYKSLSTRKGIHVDQLRAAFTLATGLDTSL